MKIHSIFASFLLLASSFAFACPEGSVKVNATTFLYGDRIRSGNDSMDIPTFMREFPCEGDACTLGMTDKIAVDNLGNGIHTHYVQLVQYHGEVFGGVFRYFYATWRVYDASGSKLLGTFRVKTSNGPGGVVSRGFGMQQGELAEVECTQVDVDRVFGK